MLEIARPETARPHSEDFMPWIHRIHAATTPGGDGDREDVITVLKEFSAAYRARVAELEEARDIAEGQARLHCGDAIGLRDDLAAARARIAELEAVQRPSLGYVVISRRPNRLKPGEEHIRTAGPVWPRREVADGQLAYCEEKALMDPRWYGDTTHLVAELREAQP